MGWRWVVFDANNGKPLGRPSLALMRESEYGEKEVYAVQDPMFLWVPADVTDKMQKRVELDEVHEDEN